MGTNHKDEEEDYNAKLEHSANSANPYPPEPVFSQPDPEPIEVCRCILPSVTSEVCEIPERKKMVLTTVSRTEAYLRERRIPELIRYLLTKVIANGSKEPLSYLEKLLDDCMLFRAGHATAPVLYKHRHLQAVIKSFDPGERGWLSAGQVRRAFITLGLTPPENVKERMSCEELLNSLTLIQEQELCELISAGMTVEEPEKEIPVQSSDRSGLHLNIST